MPVCLRRVYDNHVGEMHRSCRSSASPPRSVYSIRPRRTTTGARPAGRHLPVSHALPFHHFFFVVTSISARRRRVVYEERQLKVGGWAPHDGLVSPGRRNGSITAPKRPASSRLNWIHRKACPSAIIRPLMPTYNSPISQHPWLGVMNVMPAQIYERPTTRMQAYETVDDGGWAARCKLVVSELPRLIHRLVGTRSALRILYAYRVAVNLIKSPKIRHVAIGGARDVWGGSTRDKTTAWRVGYRRPGRTAILPPPQVVRCMHHVPLSTSFCRYPHFAAPFWLPPGAVRCLRCFRYATGARTNFGELLTLLCILYKVKSSKMIAASWNPFMCVENVSSASISTPSVSSWCFVVLQTSLLHGDIASLLPGTEPNELTEACQISVPTESSRKRTNKRN